MKAASLIVEIGADTGGALSGLRQVSQAIGSFSRSAASTLAGVLGADMLRGSIAGLQSLAAEALNATVSWERLNFTIESMMAREIRASHPALSMKEALEEAQGAAKDTLKWITELAIRSPFETEAVAAAYRMQLSLGATSQEARQMTTALLDMAAATGMGTAELDRAAYAISQIRGADRLLVQDLRQLINAGIDVNSILARLGVKLSEVGEKAVEPSRFIQAFLESAKEYGGAVDRMANSWSGLMGALNDVRTIGLREFFAGTLAALRPLVQELTDWILGPGLPLLRKWGDEFGQALANVLPSIRNFAIGGIGILQNAFAWIIQNWATISAALKGILTGLLAFGAVAGVAALLSSLTNPLTLLIAAMAALGIAWQNNLLGIRDVSRGVFAFVLDWFWRLRAALMTYLPQAIEALHQFWETRLLPPLQAFGNWVQQKIMPHIRPLADAIKNFLAEGFRVLADVVTRFVFPALTRLWQEISSRALPVLRGLATFLGEAIPKILIGLTRTFQIATILTRRFGEELRRLQLPSWLTPGSPTPLENGLRGIGNAMRQLSHQPAPALFTSPATMATSAVAAPSISITINAKTDSNPKEIANEVLAAVREALREAYQ